MVLKSKAVFCIVQLRRTLCITFYHDLTTAVRLNDNSINKQVYMKQQKNQEKTQMFN